MTDEHFHSTTKTLPLKLSEYARIIGAGLAFTLTTPLLEKAAARWGTNYPALSKGAKRAKDILQQAATKRDVAFSLAQGIPLFIHSGTYETSAYTLSRYEPFTREIFVSYLRPGARVLDLGAQFGIYSILAARRSYETKVVAFEPEPNNFALLELNIRLNRVTERITAYRLAAGDSHSIVDFFVYEDSDSHAIHRHPEAKVKEVIRQEIVSIDQFLEVSEFDLVKMDIEGHEPYALEGMKKTLEISDDVVLITELAPEYLLRAGVDPTDYLSQLRSFGFETRVIDEQRKLLRPVELEFLSEGPPGRVVNLLCRRR